MERRPGAGFKAVTDHAKRQALIDRLRQPPVIGSLSYAGLRTVASFRLLAVCSNAGGDPMLELTQRFGCAATAKAFLVLADRVGRYWPDDVNLTRPCARVLSPDEKTLAQMVDAALVGDRPGFGRLLSGFVRNDRHEKLYQPAVELAALL